jgi:hypothetical protein
LLKDPRLCLTLRSWLPLFRKLPAVVFTYRHPIEVCQSLVARSAATGTAVSGFTTSVTAAAAAAAAATA